MLSPATQYEWKTRSLRPDGRADAPVFSTLARRDPWTVFARGSATQYSRPLKAHCASAHTRISPGSMGVDVGDYDGSGRPALWVTNFQGELHGLYRNLGRETFRHESHGAGIAALGQYFVSFNRDRSLSADVIHYASGTVSGRGAFAIPGVGVGQLRVTSATPYGGYLPNGTGTSGVPESSIATGTATFLTGQRVPFTLDLHSNYWPNATNTYDTATLYFCPVATYTSCTPYPFFGELHHEPQ